MVDPTVSVNGVEVGEADDTSLTFGLLGLGLTYYFPSDVYLTGVLGASLATLETPGLEAQSETGWGGAFDVGGEWHLAEIGGWALPGGSRFTQSRMKMTPGYCTRA